MKKLSICFVSLLAISGSLFAMPPVAQPVIKNGSCPSGYISSGDYCLSSK